MSTAPCSRCAGVMDMARAMYTDEGDLVCATCHSAVTVEQSYAKAARATAMATFASGMFTMILALFVPIAKKLFAPLVGLGLVGTIGSYRLLGRPEYRRAAASSYARLRMLALGGVVLSLLGPVLLVAMLVAFSK